MHRIGRCQPCSPSATATSAALCALALACANPTPAVTPAGDANGEAANRPVASTDAAAPSDTPATDSAAPVACSPLDQTLRFDHVQALGTHNSYHVAPAKPVVADFAYTHSPLADQFDHEGVRHVELDLHHRGAAKPIEVEHVPFLDDNTRCETLGLCLGQLKAWSDQHPCHHLIVVLLEVKDELNESKLEDHFAQLDAEVLAALPRNRLFTPDDLRGTAPDLRTAVRATGWRSLAETRGKFALVMMEGDAAVPKYKGLHPGLHGATTFVFGDPDDKDVAAVKRDDPTAKDIQALVKLGYVVRTYPNGTVAERTAALESGATLISTDFPVEKPHKPGFSIQLPGGMPSRCNPVSAPVGCAAAAVNAGVP